MTLVGTSDKPMGRETEEALAVGQADTARKHGRKSTRSGVRRELENSSAKSESLTTL